MLGKIRQPLLSNSLLSLACLFAPFSNAEAIQKHKHTHKIFNAETGILVQYQKRPEVITFIEEMIEKHGFPRAELNRVFERTRYLPAAARLIVPTGPSKPKMWSEYRARFVEPKRIEGGVKFWQDNAATLAHAAQEYGVPEEIIVAIIGVETVYGRNPGSFRVIDALTTLSFDYPAAGNNRAPFFRSQLEDYLLFARASNLNVFEVRGSYAGAIGMPQFMPGSWRRYAVDYDQDGKIDLRNNSVDAIGSVANFLQAHGWVRQQPTHFSLTLNSPPPEFILATGIEPQWTAAQLDAAGLRANTTIDPQLKLALIDLPNGSTGPVYFLGTQNFYTITRYNRSSFYAMSVIELAQTIRQEYHPLQNEP